MFASWLTLSTMALRLRGEIELACSQFPPLDGDRLRSPLRSLGPHRAVHQPRGILQSAGGGRDGRCRIGRDPVATPPAEPRSDAILAFAGLVEHNGHSFRLGSVLWRPAPPQATAH